MRWIAFLLFAVPAWAGDLHLTHTGTLADHAGVGLNGVEDLTVVLYDANGTPVWQHRYDDVPIISGHYEVMLDDDLGGTNVGDVLTGSTPATSVGVRVGDAPELTPRAPLTAVPIAARSRGVRVEADVLSSPCPGDGALVFDDAVQMLAVCASQTWVPIPFDQEPDPFAFPSFSNLELSTLVTSAAVTPTGYLGPVPVTVTGSGSPQLSVNGGAWVSAGTLNPGESLQLRTTTSGSYGTAFNVNVSAGDTDATWSVTTKAQCPASCTPSGANQCVCSGTGSGSCPSGAQWDCGVYASWTAGTAQRCVIPSGWTYVSGSRQSYRHGSTPNCSYTLTGNQSFSFVLQRQ